MEAVQVGAEPLKGTYEWRHWIKHLVRDLIPVMETHGWHHSYDHETACRWFNGDPYAIEVFVDGPRAGRFYVQNYREPFAPIVLSGRVTGMTDALTTRNITANAGLEHGR